MTRDECKPGDLVGDDKGRRWIIGNLGDWSKSEKYVWGWPATKKGKPDQRKDGGYLDPAWLTLIHREGSDGEAKDATA